MSIAEWLSTSIESILSAIPQRRKPSGTTLVDKVAGFVALHATTKVVTPGKPFSAYANLSLKRKICEGVFALWSTTL